VEEARQSQKVTLIGVNTAGVSDYGNLHSIAFPCGNFTMSYPTTRSSAVDVGKGIDTVGIPPDIRLDTAQKDWVEFARLHLHKK
jgi:C-terminal processing protease CtpA/Prc